MACWAAVSISLDVWLLEPIGSEFDRETGQAVRLYRDSLNNESNNRND